MVRRRTLLNVRQRYRMLRRTLVRAVETLPPNPEDVHHEAKRRATYSARAARRTARMLWELLALEWRSS